MIDIRKGSEYGDAVVWGEFAPEFKEEKRLIAYTRTTDDQQLLIVCSFLDEVRELELSKEGKLILGNGGTSIEGKTLKLDKFGCAVIEL